MRTSRAIAILCLVGGALLSAAPAGAFDGTPSPTRLPGSPVDAARQGTMAFRAGNLGEAIAAWTRAAENGHLISAWRLGRMFADGEGVQRDPQAAFRWFSQIVENQGDVEPGSSGAQIMSRAMVEVGSFYLVGIPNTDVRQDFARAWGLFYQAASVFGDADAQFNLGRMYLDGAGVEYNPRAAAIWLRAAADKNHRSAQATLGEMLFAGRVVQRRPVEGLMWLSLARQQARSARDTWIVAAFEDAFTLATDEERTQAATAVRQWRARSPSQTQ